MANFIKIAVLAPEPPVLRGTPGGESAVDDMIEHWDTKAARVLPDEPDLIVLPECSDRYSGTPREKMLEYYGMRGEKIAHFWRKKAGDNKCVIAYSAVRDTGKGFFNATEIIGRNGQTAGIYLKNYPTMEELESGIFPGSEAPLIDCGFGKIACAICFDLNFESLRLKYAAQKPDIILFSSMYHGGLMQNYWAYSCRSHFAGAVAPAACRGSVISPVGSLLAETTNYHDFTVHTVNLDCGVFHLDCNRMIFPAIKNKYGQDVSISDPGLLGSVLVSAEAEGLDMTSIREEFGLEPLDDYFSRAAAERNSRLQ